LKAFGSFLSVSLDTTPLMPLLLSKPKTLPLPPVSLRCFARVSVPAASRFSCFLMSAKLWPPFEILPPPLTPLASAQPTQASSCCGHLRDASVSRRWRGGASRHASTPSMRGRRSKDTASNFQ